jgi:hypothetical protein
MATCYEIAIIGGGPRGLSIAERILAYARVSTAKIRLTVYERGPVGVGVHRPEQPDYLFLNTVAGQATMYSDPAMVVGAPVTEGPNFLEWARLREILVPGIGELRPVTQADFLPRRLFGEYLAQAGACILSTAPESVFVELVGAVVVDVRPDGHRVCVTDTTTSETCFDLVFVATGHGLGTRGAADGAVAPYPLPDSVSGITAGARVGIAGMGLTAVDVVAALTIGRGGRFDRNGDTLAYHASGNEPHLTLFSRSGWLPAARPASPRVVPADSGRYLTLPAIDAARRQSATGRLAFRGTIWPLIRKEVGGGALSADAHRAVMRFLGVPVERFATAAHYRDAVLAQATFDLREAGRALGDSEYKERLEALRDQREVLRAVVDAPGLHTRSHRAFFDVVPSVANRVAVGPQPERLAELLALHEAGVLDFGPGGSPRLERNARGWTLSSTVLDRPATIHLDAFVRAHLDLPERDGQVNPLWSRLQTLAHGHVDNRFLALARDGRLRDGGRTVSQAIVVIGPPAEGASYYNNYVLWPGVPSRALSDIDRVVAPLFGESGSR